MMEKSEGKKKNKESDSLFNSPASVRVAILSKNAGLRVLVCFLA